jgi:ubiquitin
MSINIQFIEDKINKMLAELERNAMECVMDEKIDKKHTNIYMKPIVSAKKILLNALDSIKMAEKLAQKELS